MQIGTTNSLMPAPPVDPTPASNQDPAYLKRVVTAVRALNEAQLYGQDRELQFALDRVTKTMVIKVVQQGTGEVVRQIPSEEVLHAFAAVQEMQRGKEGQSSMASGNGAF